MTLEVKDKAVKIPELAKEQARELRADPGVPIPELSKTALSGFLGELVALGEIKEAAPADGVSRDEALNALNKLKELEATKPSPAEVGRGLIAGGIGGTASSLARGLTSGDVVKGVRGALQAPTLAGKAGKLIGGAAKGAVGSMAGYAAFGSTAPFLKRKLDQEAEKAKLREYLGVSRRGKVRREVAKTLGVG